MTKAIKRFSLLVFLISVATNTWAANVLRISTTTSTENSGLLAVLHPVFEEKYNVSLEVIAVGTGKALKMGGQGDVDVVLAHAPTAELKYVASGDFIDRLAVMHNDFVMVGPRNDPAGIGSAKNIEEALRAIAQTKSAFISRGDDSGTHKKEKALWENAGIKPLGDWYVDVGQGMGAVLNIANEKLDLIVLFEGDVSLFNPYHVMAVNPAKHKQARYDWAKKYIAFVTGPEGQEIIRGFRKGGQQLFHPDAL